MLSLFWRCPKFCNLLLEWIIIANFRLCWHNSWCPKPSNLLVWWIPIAKFRLCWHISWRCPKSSNPLLWWITIATLDHADTILKDVLKPHMHCFDELLHILLTLECAHTIFEDVRNLLLWWITIANFRMHWHNSWVTKWCHFGISMYCKTGLRCSSHCINLLQCNAGEIFLVCSPIYISSLLDILKIKKNFYAYFNSFFKSFSHLFDSLAMLRPIILSHSE